MNLRKRGLRTILDGLLSPDDRHAFDMHVNAHEHCGARLSRRFPFADRSAFAGANRAAAAAHHCDSEPNDWAARNQERLARCIRLGERSGFARFAYSASTSRDRVILLPPPPASPGEPKPRGSFSGRPLPQSGQPGARCMPRRARSCQRSARRV